MNKFLNYFLLILFIVFIFILISSSTNQYAYKNNRDKEFTEEKIKQFEKDVMDGKKVDINDYLVKEDKDYSNNITKMGDYLSGFVNKSVNYILKEGFNFIEKLIE